MKQENSYYKNATSKLYAKVNKLNPKTTACATFKAEVFDRLSLAKGVNSAVTGTAS